MKTERSGVKSDRTDWLRAHLTAILASSPDAIISQSLDGIITDWNPAAEALYGYTASEAIESPISIIVPADRAGEETELLARISRGEMAEQFETTRIRRDGTLVEVALTISPMRNPSGDVIGASTIARDIRAQRLAAEQIYLEKERLQATLTSIGDGVIVTDGRGYVQFLNPAAEALTRWQQSEARGKPLETVFDIIDERSRQRVESPAARAMRKGVPVGMASHTLLVARDGTEVAIDDSAAPIRNQKGAANGVVLVFRDVSGIRAVESIRARLSAIVEGSTDAIISKDLEGRITSWNEGAEGIFGYSQKEAIGRPITMLIPPDRLAEEAEILRQLRRGSRVKHFETIRLTKDRRKVPVSLTISPIYDAEGKVIGASKIARDISDRKTAERELAQVNEQLKQYAENLQREVDRRTLELRESLKDLEAFSSSLSHDLKTPLRAIAGHALCLKEDLGQVLPAKAQEHLSVITQTCGRLGRFVDNVLSYTRLGSAPVETTSIDLDALVRRVIEEYPHAKQANAEVEINSPLFAVVGNEALLTQVVANLLSNAVKFIPPGRRPRVRVWSEQEDGKVRVCVQDNGIGIAKADQPSLFSLFKRMRGTEHYDGTGVGLAVVQRAVRRMGGVVGVESEKGQGSRFWFELNPAEEHDGNHLKTGLNDIADSVPRIMPPASIEPVKPRPPV